MGSLGQNRVLSGGLQPEVMPAWARAAISAAKTESSVSENRASPGSRPRTRTRNAAIWPLVTYPSGQKWEPISSQPRVTPAATIDRISPAKGASSATSRKVGLYAAPGIEGGGSCSGSAGSSSLPESSPSAAATIGSISSAVRAETKRSRVLVLEANKGIRWNDYWQRRPSLYRCLASAESASAVPRITLSRKIGLYESPRQRCGRLNADHTLLRLSLHREGLGQVAGLVDVESLGRGQVIGQDLERHHGGDSADEIGALRHLNQMIRHAVDLAVAFLHHQDD